MKNGQHWPYTIIALIIFVMFSCIYTVYLSFGYPVDDDESYFKKYQDVEKNFAQIKSDEEEFLKYFQIEIIGNSTKLDVTKRNAIIIDDNKVTFKIIEKSNFSAKNISTIAKLTRPHTKNFDKNINVNFDENNKIFTVDLGKIHSGRWLLLIEFKFENLSKFYKIELCKNRCKK